MSGSFGQEPSRRGNQARSERVAQTVEHVTFNHGVLGSIPSALTNEINRLDRIWVTVRKHQSNISGNGGLFRFPAISAVNGEFNLLRDMGESYAHPLAPL